MGKKKEYQETLSNCTPQPSKTASKTNKVVPKSINQKNYLKAIEENDMVFGIGPAGTGKSFLAIAMAVSFYLQNKVKKIILIRPAVEAGEKLGFLPGDLSQKIAPYLTPLSDALDLLLEPSKVDELMESGVIELAPIAFLRGRTLSDAAVVLDEMQNATCEQMKMVVTRLGYGSKFIVNGDLTQIDLPRHVKSGLVDARETLEGVEGISFIEFDDSDVVRHPLVQRIVRAYETQKELKERNEVSRLPNL
jgi:phosphate starvation-inducible PhoH-like protein